jgi:hypothetical protein
MTKDSYDRYDLTCKKNFIVVNSLDINRNILCQLVTDYQDRFLFKLICKDLVQNDKTVFYCQVLT